tara:strand:- start:11185 stop:12996 length:1812 start_codon:yes stop_codon:yes gene_type:complete
MPRKPQKTLFDYLGILISPVLIMMLVGSIVFFVLEYSFNDFRYEGKLKWVMFWFVCASVLIGRIAIERGTGMAGFYALGLATAVGLWTNKFLGFVPLIWFLLAFVWWCSHMLTKDCTLIDDTEDASGEGLIEASGLSKSKEEEKEAVVATGRDGLPKRPPKRKSLLRRMLPDFSKNKGKPHAPGKWIVWFSLLALPAFGIVHALMDKSEAAVEQSYGFQLLMLYVIAALCLLMITSFLGLRRYLRQRYLKMPMTVTGQWLLMGGGVALTILLLALLLPRPNASYDMTALIDEVSAQVQKASDRAFSDKDGLDDESKKNFKQSKEKVDSDRGKQENSGGGDKQGKSGTSGDDAKPGEKDGQGEAPSKEQSKDKKGDDNDAINRNPGKAEDQKKSERGGNEREPSERKGKEEGAKTEKKLSEEGKFEDLRESKAMQSPEWIGPAVKVAIYCFFGGVALFFLIRHRKAIMEGLRKFLEDLMQLFGKRPAKKKTTQAAAEAQEPKKPEKPFCKFPNPFLNGAVHRESPEEIINYSYRAMEAWAYEHDLPRTMDQTPVEFGENLSENAPEIAETAPQLSQIYSEIAYTNEPAPDDSLDVAKQLWAQLR